MKLFEGTDTDLDLYPRQDPDVIACQGALQAAQALAEPAQKAWRDYMSLHADETPSVPFRRHKQQLYEAIADTTEAVDEAQRALTHALDAAIARAKDAWDTMVRQQFLDDVPVIEAFIDLLANYETTVTEAQAAGVSSVLKVPVVFITAGEVATRLAYAKKELGVD